MTKGKILVTPRSLSAQSHPCLNRLKEAGYEVITPFPGRQPSTEELKAVLPSCTGYLAGVEKIERSLLSLCNNLKVISRNGVGTDNIDREAAEDFNITVTITGGANARGVAELTLAHILCLARQIPQSCQSIKKGQWPRAQGVELYGKTLGIFGTGQIGRQVASLASALGMKVLAFDLYPSSQFEKEIFLKYVSREQLLRQSDFITLHCPPGDVPLIDREALALMKNGVYLINTARSSLVDDTALLMALNSEKVAGYAVDAFPEEPPKLTDLLLHNKVLASAHIGGYTEESVFRSTDEAVRNILKILET